ncbi:hypothetical protein EV421DRAFT_1738948 [Armillaria borealis]|uniref:Uncharacterized protein n=1 Tax=Armillaria borealis TaxID=47425 RepID=A0AA39ML62_9AGAR|nr:hypothetical protein EV421DRAFT_1738948 [Armillaria borealis]
MSPTKKIAYQKCKLTTTPAMCEPSHIDSGDVVISRHSVSSVVEEYVLMLPQGALPMLILLPSLPDVGFTGPYLLWPIQLSQTTPPWHSISEYMCHKPKDVRCKTYIDGADVRYNMARAIYYVLAQLRNCYNDHEHCLSTIKQKMPLNQAMLPVVDGANEGLGSVQVRVFESQELPKKKKKKTLKVKTGKNSKANVPLEDNCNTEAANDSLMQVGTGIVDDNEDIKLKFANIVKVSAIATSIQAGPTTTIIVQDAIRILNKKAASITAREICRDAKKWNTNYLPNGTQKGFSKKGCMNESGWTCDINNFDDVTEEYMLSMAEHAKHGKLSRPNRYYSWIQDKWDDLLIDIKKTIETSTSKKKHKTSTSTQSASSDLIEEDIDVVFKSDPPKPDSERSSAGDESSSGNGKEDNGIVLLSSLVILLKIEKTGKTHSGFF